MVRTFPQMLRAVLKMVRAICIHSKWLEWLELLSYHNNHVLKCCVNGKIGFLNNSLKNEKCLF
jgi:hypothetical protein